MIEPMASVTEPATATRSTGVVGAWTTVRDGGRTVRWCQKSTSAWMSADGASTGDETSGAMNTGAVQMGAYHGPWKGVKASSTSWAPFEP